MLIAHMTDDIAPIIDQRAMTPPTSASASPWECEAATRWMLSLRSWITVSGTIPCSRSTAFATSCGCETSVNTPSAASIAEGIVSNALKAIAWASRVI